MKIPFAQNGALSTSAGGLLIFILLLTPTLAFSPSVKIAPQTKTSDGTTQGIQKTVIAEGIYQFTASFDGYVGSCNSTVIVNEQDVLVFDTNTRPSTARAILGEIRKITDKPVRYVVNSHWHPDHWSGNEVYAQELPGLHIIATEETQQFMKNVAPSWPPLWASRLKQRQTAFDNEVSSGKQADGTPLTDEQRRVKEERLRIFREFATESAKVRRTLPTLIYQHHLTLNLGGREFRFMSLFGDADESTVLYLPKEKILLTGDLLVYPVTWGSNSYHLTPWLKSLKTLSQLDVKVIIPGHGPAFHDKNYMNLVAELFDSVITQVRAALGQGKVTVQEVQEAVKLDHIRMKFTKDDDALSASFQESANYLIKMAYLEARDGMESKR